MSRLGEVVDRFITVQYLNSGGASVSQEVPVNQRLYRAARKEAGDTSLAGSAAQALKEDVDTGDVVLIPTGFIVPPWNRTEADGPTGAPGLARALWLALEATPIIVTEQANIKPTKEVLAASGLQVVSPQQAQKGHGKVSVVSAPVNEEDELEHARDLLDSYNPSAIVTIEKPSRNESGIQHNGAGYDVSSTTAGADKLIKKARERGIVTIGIGDGGNEIGMGKISEEVSEIIPDSTSCQCPCNNGIIAATETDHLVVGATANWGAYGIEACLSEFADDSEVMHDRETEKRIHDAAARAGIVDPATGMADGWLDGMPPKVSESVVDLLHSMVDLQLNAQWATKQRNRWSNREEEVKSTIEEYGQQLQKEDNNSDW